MPLTFEEHYAQFANITQTERALTVRALERFKKDGMDVDPTDENTICAYRKVKTKCVRVSPKLLQSLANSTATDTFRTSTDHVETFWVVPVKNFSSEEPGTKRRRIILPQVVEAAVVPESELVGRLPEGVSVDFDDNMVVDQSCPRHILGRGVSELR